MRILVFPEQGRDKRPAFDKLGKDAARGRFDVVAAWSVDRLGRSLPDLLHFLEDIHGCGIDFYLYQQGIDITTPAGKAMFQMFGVFAEFERSIIRERTKAGLEAARARGKTGGRPPALDAKDLAAAKAMLSDPEITMEEVAKRLKVAPSTLYRHLPGGRSAIQETE
jgi:DNA invertase Pin-like site-specific DNA recombinase